MQFLEWCSSTAHDIVDKKDGIITLLDISGKSVARWYFSQAYPVKCDKGLKEQIKLNEAAIEMLEISYEGIEILD